MSTIAYEFAPGGPTKVGVAKRTGWFWRFIDRLIEARARQAMVELRRHSHLLPREMETACWKITDRSEDLLPFVR